MNKIITKINDGVVLKKIFFIVFVCVIFFGANSVQAASLAKAANNLSLAAYWPFSEGAGTIAGDVSGNGNTGTLNGFSSPSTSTSGWNKGRFGYGLALFNLSNYISVSDSSSLDTTSDATLSAWIKLNANSDTQPIIEKDGNYGLSVTGGLLRLRFWPGSIINANDVTAPSAGVWHHVVGVVSGGSPSAVYIDGVLAGTTVYTLSGGVGQNLGNALYMGAGFGGGYAGMIDEARVYTRALSATEIFNLYKTGARTKQTPSNNGLVGYWPFNDGSGTVAGDVSGNGSSGTLTNAPSWIMGRIGKALSFTSASSQYVDLGAPSALNLGSTNRYTLSAWVYPTSAPNDLSVISEMYTPTSTTVQYSLGFDQDGISGNSRLATGFYGGGTWKIVRASSTIPLNKWTFITGSWDGTTLQIYQNGVSVGSTTPGGSMPTTDFDKVVIGKRHDTSGAVNFFPGYIDDVRIYNRALSDPEIYSLYKNSLSGVTRKPPNNLGLIGYWPLNEGTGTSAGDASGNGNTGTLTNMASPATSTSGWGNGKFSKGLIFDGTNDYVNIANPTTFNFGTADWTVSVWAKRGAINELVNIFTKSTAGVWAASGKQLYLADSSEGYKIAFDAFGVSGSSWFNNTAITDMNWHHITVTFVDSSNLLTFYLDGAADGTANPALTADSGSHILEIATDNGSAGGFSYLDEVRIYNRALSATDIFNLYNYGR